MMINFYNLAQVIKIGTTLQRTLENKYKDLCKWSFKSNNDDEYPRDLAHHAKKFDMICCYIGRILHSRTKT